MVHDNSRIPQFIEILHQFLRSIASDDHAAGPTQTHSFCSWASGEVVGGRGRGGRDESINKKEEMHSAQTIETTDQRGQHDQRRYRFLTILSFCRHF